MLQGSSRVVLLSPGHVGCHVVQCEEIYRFCLDIECVLGSHEFAANLVSSIDKFGMNMCVGMNLQ